MKELRKLKAEVAAVKERICAPPQAPTFPPPPPPHETTSTVQGLPTKWTWLALQPLLQVWG